MKDTDFKEVSQQLSKLSHRIVRPSTLQRVAASVSFLEAAAMLTQNTDYDFSTVSTIDDVEDVLDRAIEVLYSTVYELTPHRIIVDTLSSQYDFENLKEALFAAYFEEERPPHYILASPVPQEEFDAFADPSDDLFESTLPSHLLNTGIEARAVFEESASHMLMSSFLDRKMYWWMLGLAGGVENDFILHYLQTAIDFYNISAVIRLRTIQKERSFIASFLIEGGHTPTEQIASGYARSASTIIPMMYHKAFGDVLNREVNEWDKKGDPARLDWLLEKMLFAFIQNAQYIEYGAEVVFSYLLQRENEIETIRFLLQRKFIGIAPETLQQEIQNPFLKETIL